MADSVMQGAFIEFFSVAMKGGVWSQSSTTRVRSKREVSTGRFGGDLLAPSCNEVVQLVCGVVANIFETSTFEVGLDLVTACAPPS